MGPWDVLMAAINLQADPNAADRADVTPLHFAADAGRDDAVRRLLAAGARINARSTRNWPPAHGRRHRDVDWRPSAIAAATRAGLHRTRRGQGGGAHRDGKATRGSGRARVDSAGAKSRGFRPLAHVWHEFL